MTPEDIKQIAQLKNSPNWSVDISTLSKIESIESKYKLKNIPLTEKINIPDIPVMNPILKNHKKVSYIQSKEVSRIFENLKTLWIDYRDTHNYYTMKKIEQLKHKLNKYRKESLD